MDFLALVGQTARFSRKQHGEDMKLFEQKSSETSGRRRKRRRSVTADSSSEEEEGTDEDESGDSELESSSSSGEEEEEADDDPRFWYSHPSTDDGTDASGDDEITDASDEEGKPGTDWDPSDPRKVQKFRRRHKIRVTGQNIPAPVPSFQKMIEIFGLPKVFLNTLTVARPPDGFGFKDPSPIQMQAISCMLAGREVMGVAPTGSGKTVAFLLPLFCLLKEPQKDAGIRAIVLAPTRELAQQIYETAKILSSGLGFRILYLRKSNANKNTFQGAARDLVVTTPLRLVSLIENKHADLSSVEHLVMDEADRLFEQGFLEQVDTILTACSHKKLRRHLFSATMSQGVEELVRTVLTDPVRIVVGARNFATLSVEQKLQFVGDETGKRMALREIISQGLEVPALIFVQSADRAQQLHEELTERLPAQVSDRIRLDVISSNLTPNQRTEAVKRFRMGETWVLICTDLMSRGIDFKGVNLVINYDFPQSVNSYIHRIGRTGRAGRPGKAITYFTHADTTILKNIARLLRQAGCEVPDWMLRMRSGSRRRKKQLQLQAPPRESITASAKIKRLQRNLAVQEKKRQKRALKSRQRKKQRQQKQQKSPAEE